jgi:hypothetical protein
VKSRALGWKVASALLFVLGLAGTIVVAYLGVDDDPGLDVVTAVTLTAFSGIFQILSVIFTIIAARPDPNLVRNVSRRLSNVQARLGEAVTVAEVGVQQARSKPEQVVVGRLSVSLSVLQDHVYESMQTWRDLSPELFEREDKRS